MPYGLSALWRHAHGWIYPLWIAIALVAGLFGGWVALSLIWLLGFCWMSWELVAQARAARAGFPVLYILPSPAPWVRRRLRALGYPGPVARRIWEMHVQERTRWVQPGGTAAQAVARFRAAYTADRVRWLQDRPPDRGLIITTFNRLPPTEIAALRAAGAWVGMGPLDPRIPAKAFTGRTRAVQQRMFGAVVSTQDRTEPGGWTTIYVPPRQDMRTAAICGP